MNWIRILQGFGALGIAVGGIAIWFAFQRPTCTTVAGGPDQCGPNVAFLIPGALAALIGLTLLALVRGYNQHDESQIAGT